MPSDSRAHGDSKISKLPDKIWRSKRKYVFGLATGERKPKHSGRYFIFLGENPEK